MRTEIYNELALHFVENETTDETLFTGFSSESGEVMKERMKEVRKKMDRTDEIIDECSDVLWYITIKGRRQRDTLKTQTQLEA